MPFGIIHLGLRVSYVLFACFVYVLHVFIECMWYDYDKFNITIERRLSLIPKPFQAIQHASSEFSHMSIFLGFIILPAWEQ